MKRMMLFIVIGLILFGAGIGGGIYFGTKFRDADNESGSVRVAAPGPVVPAGDFTVNLAGSGNRIVSFSVSMEFLNSRVGDLIVSQNWLPRIRNEILLLAKDKVFEDLTKAEGVIQLGEQIKRNLNTILPTVNGEVAVVRIMFESFVLQ